MKIDYLYFPSGLVLVYLSINMHGREAVAKPDTHILYTILSTFITLWSKISLNNLEL